MRQIKPIYPLSSPGEDFIKIISHRPDFEQAIDNIRKKWKINVGAEIYITQDLGDEGYVNEIRKNKAFIKDVRKLQKTFELGDQWSTFVEGYIFIDFFDGYTSNIFIEKRTGKERDSITGKPTYYLRIFPETTQDDIVKSWEEINKFVNGRKIKTKRQKPSRKHARARVLYNLAKGGLYIEDIETYYKKWFGKSLDYAVITTDISRYRKRLGIVEPCEIIYKKSKKSPLSVSHTKLIMGFPPIID